MKLDHFPFRSVKARVTLLTLAIFLIGIWSHTLYATRMLREDMQNLLGEQQFSKVTLLTAQVNQELNNRLLALDRIARDIDPNLITNQAALQQKLEQSSILQTLFNGGTRITRLDGSVAATVPLTAERLAANYAERDYVLGALREGKPTIGRPVIGKVLKSPVIGMAAPIRDGQGKYIGTVTGAIDLSKPNFLNELMANSQSDSTGYLLLVAPQYRLIITASDKSRIMEKQPDPGINPVIDSFMQGYEGSALMTNPLGVEVLASAKGIPVASWIVVNSLPTEKAFAPLRTMQHRMLLAAAFLSLLAGALAWWITVWMLRRQLAPMLAATRTLATMSDTDQPPQPLPVASQDEIGELIGGFNRLLETLAEREAALRKSEQRYRLVVETASEGIVIAQGEYLKLTNPMILELIGYTAEEMVSTPFQNFIHPEDRELARSNYLKRLAGEAADRKYPIRILPKDAGVKWVEVSGARIDWEGQPAALNFIADITERMQVEELKKEAYERLAAVLNSLDAIVYVADMETYELLFINKPVENLFGDIVGQPCWKTMQTGQSGPCSFCTNDKLLDDAGNPRDIYRWEFQNTVNGHWYDIRDRAIRWVDGRIVRLEIATDITQRKHAEVELLRSNSELEQFSYSISHDMRQPLRMISSYMQLLERSLSDHLDDEQRVHFGFAVDGAKRLDAMMLGLLEYSRVGRKGEPRAWIESRALFDEALQFLGPEIVEAQAEVRIEGDWPRVFVSRDEFLRLMQNLIDNALKFRVAGRKPEIALASELVGTEWRMTVADNGVGIVPDQIGRLFQVFQRLQSRAHYQGTGIGLALCRKIVEHHHGRIWAESQGEGQGSRFCVALPQEATSHAPSAQ